MPDVTLQMLSEAVGEALRVQGDEERFILAVYFLDGRTLHQIGAVLGVHEATVSRKVKRTTEAVRKQVVKNLQRRGMSRRQAEEALEADPRDVRLASGPGGGQGNSDGKEWARWKELLQSSRSGAFRERRV